MVQAQTQHLQKTLGRFDIVFLVVAAVVSIEVLGEASGFGAETFTWTAVLTVLFLLPYALIFSETGGAFTDEGGIYVWTRLAFGRIAGAIVAMLTWVTTPVWIGGTMAFIAAETWMNYITPLESGSIWDYAFKLLFIWLTVMSAILSLKYGKWLPTMGAVVKVLFLVFFLVVTVIYGVQNGFQGLTASDFNPTLIGFFGLVPLLLFSFLGFESGNSAAGEMKNPGRDVPISIARSAGIAALSYLLPILAILLVVPLDEISGIGGLFEAIGRVFVVFGPAQGAITTLSAIAFVVILVSQGGAWMIISDRMQAMAAADGSFFGGFFGKFSARFGTPIRVNTLSGITATVFMIAAMQLTGDGADLFAVVLTICISTFLMSYLIGIPAAVRLRRKYPDVPRPFRVPVNDKVFAVLGGICFFWILLGTWVAIFPGTLEALFGVDYPFEEYWGVSQGTFEAFTLSTLGVILLIGIVGYVRGKRIREGVVIDEPNHVAVEELVES